MPFVSICGIVFVKTKETTGGVGALLSLRLLVSLTLKSFNFFDSLTFRLLIPVVGETVDVFFDELVAALHLNEGEVGDCAYGV